MKDQTISPNPWFAEVHLVHGVGHARRPLVHHVAVLEPTTDDGLTTADVDMVILLGFGFASLQILTNLFTLKMYAQCEY